jgi:hypothetical protein
MRATEFINENFTHEKQDEFRADTKAAMPNMTMYTDADNSSPYNGWRFGIALAGAPDHKMPAKGASGQKMVIAPYAPEEDTIIKSAAAMIGITPTAISTAGSHELTDAGTVSPIAKPRKNRYGV